LIQPSYADLTAELAFVEKLISYGAKADQKNRFGPPLIWAAIHDDLPLATLLLAHQANPNSVLMLGRVRCTPLAAAVARDSVPMATVLLENQASASALDGRCATVAQGPDAGSFTVSAKMRALLPKP